MIVFLAAVFFGMAVYGVAVGQFGAAILSLLMCAFVYYAGRVFAAQDQAYANDPERASTQASTSDALQQHDSECMRDRI